jgi:hypothetical protein
MHKKLLIRDSFSAIDAVLLDSTLISFGKRREDADIQGLENMG